VIAIGLLDAVAVFRYAAFLLPFGRQAAQEPDRSEPRRA